MTHHQAAEIIHLLKAMRVSLLMIVFGVYALIGIKFADRTGRR